MKIQILEKPLAQNRRRLSNLKVLSENFRIQKPCLYSLIFELKTRPYVLYVRHVCAVLVFGDIGVLLKIGIGYS